MDSRVSPCSTSFNEFDSNTHLNAHTLEHKEVEEEQVELESYALEKRQRQSVYRATTEEQDKRPAMSKRTSSSQQLSHGEEEGVSEGIGCCGYVLLILSGFLIFITLPFSLCLCIKVVQEYERAIIFRLGRLLPGGPKGLTR